MKSLKNVFCIILVCLLENVSNLALEQTQYLLPTCIQFNLVEVFSEILVFSLPTHICDVFKFVFHYQIKLVYIQYY